MARYRKIDTRIWIDRKFNLLSEDGKWVFFLLLTHPNLLPIGAMRHTLQGLASELHWSMERFKKGFDELLNQTMVKYDANFGFIWLPNFIKYNIPNSPNVVRSWDEYLDYLPECSLKDELVLVIAMLINELSDTFRSALPEAFAKALGNQEQEQEQKQKQNQEKTHTHNACEKKLFPTKDDRINESEAIEILNFLNEKANKVFTPSSYNLKFIRNCLRSASIDDCKRVIVRKCRKWKGDVNRDDWLRPMTIFGERFHQYLGELTTSDSENEVANT